MRYDRINESFDIINSKEPDDERRISQEIQKEGFDELIQAAENVVGGDDSAVQEGFEFTEPSWEVHSKEELRGIRQRESADLKKYAEKKSSS